MPKLFRPAARVASRAYGAVVAARSARWDRGIGVRSVQRPVISVGNIVAGGTGKSPMVRWIAAWMIDRGVVPLIALRGYRSSDGRSDEAMEHQACVPGARLAVGADRLRVIDRAIGQDPSIGVVILDDGFQHRAIKRDLDLVLIDGGQSNLDGALLPLGWLREPPASLARASSVIVTRARTLDPALDAVIHSFHGRPALAWCDHAWDGLEIHQGAGFESAKPRVESSAWLNGRRIAVWAGIAQPSAFALQLRSHGAEIVAVPRLRDHARYGPASVTRLAEVARSAGATAIATTRKDWVKLATCGASIGLPLVVPRLRLKFHQGEAALSERLERVLAGK